MKALGFILKPNEELPSATTVQTELEGGTIESLAKMSKSAIMHQLRGVGCNDAEVIKYTQTIRMMLNQYDDATDFPIATPIA